MQPDATQTPSGSCYSRPDQAGLEFHQLVRASDLSPSQVRSGLAALKDQAAERGWPPLTWTRQAGYQLGADRAVLEAYERTVVREKLTEFRRFITGTVAPHAAAHPNDKWVKHIVAQLNSISPPSTSSPAPDLWRDRPAGGPAAFEGPRHASSPLSLGHHEHRMGADRTAAADPACETSKGGRPEKHPRREIVDAIRYVVDTMLQMAGPACGFPALAHSLGVHGPLGRRRDHRPDP